MENQEEEKNKNPFKELESNHQPPAHMKDKVMSSVNFSNMLLDITELFTSNMANSVTGLFKIKNDNEDDPNKKSN